jgi:hypothetical protein
MTETVITPPPHRRRGWGTLLGATALALSALNLAVDTGSSVGANEAGQTILVKATAKECKKEIAKGKDCAVIEKGAVTAGALAPNSVDTTKLAPNSVTVNDVAPRAIDSGKLADGSVTGPKIKDDAVTGPKIGDNAVSSPQIAPGAVGASDVGKIGLPSIRDLMPTVRGIVSSTDISVVSTRYIGQPDPNVPATNSAAVPFDRFKQTGADWRCTMPASGLPCLRAPVAGTYLLSMKVSWASTAPSSSSSRIAFVFLPDETGLLNEDTVVAASGGGGVLASALPTSSDGKQTQSFSQLVTVEEGQPIILVLDYVDPLLLPPAELAYTAEISLVLQ